VPTWDDETQTFDMPENDPATKENGHEKAMQWIQEHVGQHQAVEHNSFMSGLQV